MQVTAIYPGTFDPITNGHADLVRRAAKVFGKVVLAIAASSSKNPLFTLDERAALAREVLSEFKNVEVTTFGNLMVEYARDVGASVIIRGLRAVSDFEYEVQLAGMNRSMQPNIETVYLSPAVEFTFLSSTLIKDIARHGGDVAAYVHPAVLREMNKKLTGSKK